MNSNNAAPGNNDENAFPEEKGGAVKIILLAASSLTIMSSATIAPALPEISAHFKDVPDSAVLSRLVLTMPALFIAIGAPLAGLILDKFGRVKPLIWGLSLYALSGTAGFFLDDIYWLLISRALLGLAVSALMSACTTLIGDYFQGKERTLMMGLQGTVMAGGGVLYILAGGALALVSWRAPFLVYLFSLILLPLAGKHLREPQHVSGKMPAGSTPEETAPVFTIILVFLTGFTGMLLFYMVPVHIPFILEKFDTNSVLTGIAIASSTVVGALVSSQYQKIKARMPYLSIYAGTFLFMGIGYYLISEADSYREVLAGLIVNGLGMGAMMPNSGTWLMSVTPVSIRGRIVGGMTMCIFTGQFLSAIVLEPLIDRTGLAGAFYYAAVFMLSVSALFFLFSFKIFKPK